MNRFDWPALMRAGLHRLGLQPSEFWALTPAELMMMLGAGPGQAPLNRNRLDELLAAFPDKPAMAPGPADQPGGTGDGRD